jgi:hypothetical protein
MARERGEKMADHAVDSSSASDRSSVPSFADVKAAATETKRGRGRPVGSGRKSTEDAGGASARDKENAAQLDALFRDENWQEVAGLYFQARYAMTGWDGFPLTEGQKSILGSTLACSMRALIAIDPKWVALTIFTINFGAVIVQKEVAFKALQIQAEELRGEQHES